jgi:hypothetical protein
MAAFDPNIFLGELLNSPVFWIMACIIGFMWAGFHFNWFGKMKRKPSFKEENLTDSLLKDLEPRMKVQGKKIKNSKLMQNMINFGKVRKYSISKAEFQIKEKRSKVQDEKPELTTQQVDLVYLLVGGNPWLNWIPYIGKAYESEYFVMNKGYVKHDAQSKIFEIHPDVHVYPYAKIWISDKKTQRYLTELEARRTIEFEAETNINTLKRWTYYGEPQAGRVVVMEKDVQLEQDKWDHTREVAD